jgi:hypothetical protein
VWSFGVVDFAPKTARNLVVGCDEILPIESRINDYILIWKFGNLTGTVIVLYSDFRSLLGNSRHFIFAMNS